MGTIRLLLLKLSLFFLCVPLLSVGQEPVIWLKADQMGEGKSVWKDVSGNAFDAVTGAIDSLGSLNFNPSVKFFAVSEPIVIDYDLDQQEFVKVYTVYKNKLKSDTDEQYLWSFGNRDKQSFGITNQNIYKKARTYKYSHGNISTPIVNEARRYGDLNSPQVTEQFFIGCASFADADSIRFVGEIAELMVYDAELDYQKGKAVESYLAMKYGVSLFGDYYNNEGDIIWNFIDNAVYRHNVFTIGRDDNWGLYQKQSKSEVCGVIEVGVDGIYEENSKNNASIKNGNYLFFSDNGVKSKTGVSVPSDEGGSYLLSDKIWKVNEFGGRITKNNISMVVKAADLFDTVVHDIVLIKDLEYSDAFDEFEIVSADSISADGNVYFSEMSFCSSNSCEYFRFAQKSKLVVLAEYFPPTCLNNIGSVLLKITEGGAVPFSISVENGTILKSLKSNNTEIIIDDLKADNYTITVKDVLGNVYTHKTEKSLSAAEPSLEIGQLYVYKHKPIEIDLCGYSTDATFNWTLKDETVSKDCFVELINEGNYSVSVDFGNCHLSKEFLILDYSNINETGVGDSVLNTSNQIVISPNPTSANYEIAFSYNSPQDITLVISTVSGELVENHDLNTIQEYTYKGAINTPGVYIISIISAEGQRRIESYKLIIK